MPKKFENEIEEYKQKINKIHYLNGYSSTSLNKDVSLEFIFKDITDEIPLLIEITLNYGTYKGMCFNLNSDDYSAYPKESEILLDDGLGL